MKKTIIRSLILMSSVFIAHGQQWNGSSDINNNIWRNGNVGIGVVNPSSTLDVNGNIQISSSSLPMGLMTEVGGFTPLLNMSLNFREANKNFNYMGAGFRIDSRADAALFQWLKRDPGTDTEQILMSLNRNGNVGIGLNPTQYKLDVCGTIRAKEIKVDLLSGCDFVFKSDYKLMNLKALEKYVKTNQHLPEIASEKEMIENGLDMKEFQLKLLQKIEELTLYTIQQDKKIEQQNKDFKKLQSEMKKLIAKSKK